LPLRFSQSNSWWYIRISFERTMFLVVAERFLKALVI
jgi:hypothetical protein